MLGPIVRRSDFVRQLTAETVIDSGNAFIDRIQLEIGDWAMFGSSDEICSSLSDLRLAEVLTAHGEIVPLFNNQLIERLWDLHGLRFSSNPRRDPLNRADALISGTVEQVSWNFRPSGRQEGETARLAFKSQLNLTRYLQAQQLTRYPRGYRPALASDYVLAISQDESWYNEEVPLLPATNLIIGKNSKYAFALKDDRVTQTRQYLNLVLQTLQNVMENAFSGSAASASFVPYFSLKGIEFYWEFDSESPIDFVMSLRTSLLQHGQEGSEDFYDLSNSSIRTANQSPCFSVHLTQNIKVKVYAKTNRRVRFEVTLKDGAINNTVGPRSHDSIEGILALIPQLANEAAVRLTPLLQSILANPIPRGSITEIQLLHLITQDARDPYIAEAIISGLVTFGRIAPYSNDPLRHAIHRLRDRGVLRTIQPRSRIYIVTEDFNAALERLREHR